MNSSNPEYKRMIRIVNVLFVLMFPLSGFISGKIGAADLPVQPSGTITAILEGTLTEIDPQPDTETPNPDGTSTQELNTLTSEPQTTSTVEPGATNEHSTTEPTPTSSPTATISNTPSPKPTEPACNKNDVFQSQITLSSDTGGFPKINGNTVIVDEFESTEGNSVRVIQVDPTQYCRILNELKNDPSLENVEPNFQVSLLDTIPNDSDYGQQYYLTNIRAPQAWDHTTGKPAVIIAVLDSGIDLAHADLVGRIGQGYDFVENDSIPQDQNGHGTHVAGIAAANANNGFGIAGVNWQAQIMPIRVLDAYGNGSFANVAQGIIWAADHGARVINLSLGGSQYSAILDDSVQYAVQKGVILVAATGNSGSSTVLYPAAFPGVIGVGATDQSNHLAWFSNTGEGVDVVAPGVSIYGLDVGNGFRTRNGTSMSAPQVAGFAALLAGLPEMQYSSAVVAKIESSAKDLGPAGWDPQYGYGLIQIGPAIDSLFGENKPPQPSSTLTLGIPIFYPRVTATPTRTPTVGSVTPTQPVTITVTPGEIFMLQSDPSGQSSQIQDPTGDQPLTDKNAPQHTQRQFALLPIGLILVILGIGLFILLWMFRRSNPVR
jgi:subtilisin family serine protease